MKKISDLPKGEYSKGIVILIISLNVLFAAGVLIAMKFGAAEPVELIDQWFSWTKVEILVLFGIKGGKIGSDLFKELFSMLKDKYSKKDDG